MKKIIIIGASSGIGKELALLYLQQGATVAALARRTRSLEELCETNPKYLYLTADITDYSQTKEAILSLRARLGRIDMAIICAGTGELNPKLDFEKEAPTLQTNVCGWTHLIDLLYNIFEEQKGGHIAAITSLGGLRGEPAAPAYSASKAYQINYLEGLQKKAFRSRLPLYISDIRPGFVDTAMAKGEGLFWIMPADKVAAQIFKALQRKQRIAVVTKRYRPLAYLLKYLPFTLYKRL